MENIFDAEKSKIRVAALLYHKLGLNTNQSIKVIKQYGGFKKTKSNLKKIEDNFPAFLEYLTNKYKVRFTRHKVNREDRLRPYKDDQGNFIDPDNEWSDYAYTADDL